MSTQRDIASRANVSQMTVSLALRNSPTIPDLTRNRIQAIAKLLNYRPDPLVSALMRQRRKKKRQGSRSKIVFLHDNPREPSGWVSANYATGCFNGAREIALQCGYLFEAFYLDRAQLSSSRLSKILWTQNVQGLMIAPMPIGTVVDCDWNLFAAVSLDYSQASLNVHRVVDDHMAGITRIVTRLCELAYRRPALAMRASGDDRTNHNRLGAFLAQCARKSSMAAIPPFLFEGDDWNEKTFYRWLKQHRPDVVVAGDQQVVSALERSKYRIPDDLGLALYYKDERMRRHTGLSIDAHTVGAVAARTLISMIENNQRGLPSMATTTYVDAARWDDGRSLRDGI